MGAQSRWFAVVEIAGFLLTLDCLDLQFSLRLSDVHDKLKCVGSDFFKGIIKEKHEKENFSFFQFFLDYCIAFGFGFL